jgi:ubiquinone/menaquinone biosynthesis C-methylase UbiE
MDGFLANFRDLLQQTNPRSVLEVGCGEGHMLQVIQQEKPAILYGIDVDFAVLEEAQIRSSETKLAFADGHWLPYPDKAFALTVACEVLEHVADPERVLAEISRVTRDYCIVSVPREPIWRILNFVRGEYIQDLGNTPGHIQHWSSSSFVNMLQKYVDIVAVRQPLPWTMVFATIR